MYIDGIRTQSKNVKCSSSTPCIVVSNEIEWNRDILYWMKLNEIEQISNKMVVFYNDLILWCAIWFDSIFKLLPFFLADRCASNLRNASICAYVFLAGGQYRHSQAPIIWNASLSRFRTPFVCRELRGLWEGSRGHYKVYVTPRASRSQIVLVAQVGSFYIYRPYSVAEDKYR